MGVIFSKRRVVPGFSLRELLVIIAIIAVVLGMVVPALDPARRQSSRIKCVNNLKNIGLAFRVFATDHQDRFPMQVSTNDGGSMEFVTETVAFPHFAAMSNELSTPRLLVCPMDPGKSEASVFSSVSERNVSYFVGLDSTEQPHAFISGDRNLTTNGHPVKPGLLELTTNVVVGWTAEIHNGSGNATMGDGSVQQFPAARLAQSLRGIGMATNRIVVP
jgi:prepilin-type processing-associated H-X9-DG protein